MAVQFSPSFWSAMLAAVIAIAGAVTVVMDRPTRVDVQEMIDRSQAGLRSEIREVQRLSDRNYEALSDIRKELQHQNREK